jgi:hypothetical protein
MVQTLLTGRAVAQTVRVRSVVEIGAIGTGLSPSTSVFPLSMSFLQYSMHILMYMLRVLDGQLDDAWEPSIKQCCFGNHRALDRRVLLQNFNAGVHKFSKYPGAN